MIGFTKLQELYRILHHLNNEADFIDETRKDSAYSGDEKIYYSGVSEGYTQCINYITGIYNGLKKEELE